MNEVTIRMKEITRKAFDTKHNSCLKVKVGIESRKNKGRIFSKILYKKKKTPSVSSLPLIKAYHTEMGEK